MTWINSIIGGGKKITLEMKNWKRTLACAAAILVVITALTLFSGCIEEDEEDGQVDLGEPIKKVTHIVGEEGFNVDVEGNIFGEPGIYYLAEQETGAKSGIVDFKPGARAVEETYLGDDGAEIIKYKIGKKHYDKQKIEELGINIGDLYLPEDRIRLVIEKLPDGTYDLSDLTKSTEAAGWEHPEYPGYFPGSDKNTKANDNIMGNNRGKPELRTEMSIAADGERLKYITIFNKAYLKKYEKIGVRRVRPGHEFPDNDYFQWANEWKLILPPLYKNKPLPSPYKELFGGELCYMIGTTDPAWTDALIMGTPDYEYGTIIQKKSSITSLTGLLSRSATCPQPLSLQAAMPPQLTQQWLSRSTQLLTRDPRVMQVSRQQFQ